MYAEESFLKKYPLQREKFLVKIPSSKKGLTNKLGTLAFGFWKG